MHIQILTMANRLKIEAYKIMQKLNIDLNIRQKALLKL